jgi:hypothetical protein
MIITPTISLGVQIIESSAMVETVEDWSRVRSPGRARRRRHKHPQNIRIVSVPRKDAISIDGGRTLFIHPETARVLREELSKEIDRRTEAAFMGGAPAPAPGVLSAASFRRRMEFPHFDMVTS